MWSRKITYSIQFDGRQSNEQLSHITLNINEDSRITAIEVTYNYTGFGQQSCGNTLTPGGQTVDLGLIPIQKPRTSNNQ